MSLVRIAVISDDRLFSEGVVSILRDVSSFEVVERGAPADVVLIDSRLEDAFALCDTLSGDAAALLTAAPEDPDWCRDALCAGASGVLPKHAGAGELVQAVRVVAGGSVWAPRRAMAGCIKHLLSGSVARRAGSAMLEQQLSRREREIFRQAATGLANKELASRFEIGEATVKAHLTHIFQKLGVRGRAELAAVYHGATPSTMVIRQKSNGHTNGHAKK